MISSLLNSLGWLPKIVGKMKMREYRFYNKLIGNIKWIKAEKVIYAYKSSGARAAFKEWVTGSLSTTFFGTRGRVVFNRNSSAATVFVC